MPRSTFSTVSEILRRKESQRTENRSKVKFADIERALESWVRNSQKQGIPLTDSVIKEKARFFATTVGDGDGLLKINSTGWIEGFEQKRGAKSRKLPRQASMAPIPPGGSPSPVPSVGESNGRTTPRERWKVRS
jgi:hypothetical protein